MSSNGVLPSSFVRLFGVLVVIVALAGIIALLLPSLGAAKRAAMKSRLSSEWEEYSYSEPIQQNPRQQQETTEKPLAQIRKFEADVDLTPRLSVGAASPESIYEARFSADIEAVGEACEVQLPLPPQIISLADLEMTVNGEKAEDVSIRGSNLVWQGELNGPNEPAKLKVTYAAVGKGLYNLETPPGKIIETFRINLTAHGSDVRMLHRALQPTELRYESDKTVYTWDYKRLLFGRAIALDVLGIAPLDRLGELSWLAPISVLLFGVLVALLAQAYRPDKLDLWMLLLVLGTFAAAYPLMYFAQEFLPLGQAIVVSAVAVLVIIAARSASLFGWRLGLVGSLLPAVVIMGLTLVAAIHTRYQGILLTVLAIGFFVMVMFLMPRAQRSLAGRSGLNEVSPPPAPLPG